MRLRSLMVACLRARADGAAACGRRSSSARCTSSACTGIGPIAAGAAFLPQTLTVAALSLGPTAWLTARFGERRMLLVGLTALAAGLVVFATVAPAGRGVLPRTVPRLRADRRRGRHVVHGADDAGARRRPGPRRRHRLGLHQRLDADLRGDRSGGARHDRREPDERALRRNGEAAIDALAGGYQLAFIVAAGCVAAGLLASIAVGARAGAGGCPGRREAELELDLAA